MLISLAAFENMDSFQYGYEHLGLSYMIKSGCYMGQIIMGMENRWFGWWFTIDNGDPMAQYREKEGYSNPRKNRGFEPDGFGIYPQFYMWKNVRK